MSVKRSLLAGLNEIVGNALHSCNDGGKGPVRNLPVALMGSVVAVVVLLASLVSIAQAEPPKLIPYGNFSSNTEFGMGIALDQSSGDLYVAGVFNGKRQPEPVEEFDGAGNLLSPPSPFGTGYNSGIAVNPSNGELYRLNAVSSQIEELEPASGSVLESFSVPPSRNFGPFTLVQIATDATGDVYVPVVPNNDVLEYSPTGVLLNTFTGAGAGALSKPTGVAVDSSGNLWVADAGNNRIQELSAANLPLTEIKSEGIGAVAVDSMNDVFGIVHNSADFCGALSPPCFHLVEYDTAGTQVADLGAGSFGGIGLTLPIMLAVNDKSGRVYVGDGFNQRIWIYGPPTAPTIGSELTAEVGTSEAKLGALVNPGGLETSYRFEYGTTSEYGHSTPFPVGNVGQSVTSLTVWAAAAGLTSGTTYHYRVVATNALGEVDGADHSFTTETASEASCPNEALRDGFSASLPDCRAYELVTTPSQVSAQPDTNYWTPPQPWGGVRGTRAATNGNRISYMSAEVLPGSTSAGNQYLATRGAMGWSSESVEPPYSYTSKYCPWASIMNAYSLTDMSVGVMTVGERRTIHELNGKNSGCGAEGVEIVSGEPLGVQNLALRDSRTGSYTLINPPPAGVTPAAAYFKGASGDMSDVVFEEQAPLTPSAPEGASDVYVWSNGVIRLLTVLPNGTPVVGRYAGISRENSTAFFYTNTGLYVREHPEREQSALVNGDECTEPEKACTVQVDASQGPGSSGGGIFQAVSSDGSRVLFTDTNRLTSDATAQVGEPDLYECALPTVGAQCTLTDLTVASAGEHANVVRLAGVAEDGSYVYFVATGVLAGNRNSNGATAERGDVNLYVIHGGVTTFIAAEPLAGSCFAGAGEACTQASPNGVYLAFSSYSSLTGYDNVDSTSAAADPEVFLFDAASGSLACASCDPSGAPPTAGGASIVPRAFVQQNSVLHYISDSGRLFFQTTEALLPGDTNGQRDVYEYERGGLSLISTGTSTTETNMLDASESGNDVFLLTRQKLLAQDTNEEALSIYDARVDGGFPEIASLPPCTTPEGCRGAVSPQSSLYGAPASQTFSGVGDLMPPAKAISKKKSKPKKSGCRKGFVKRKGRCAKGRVRRKARKSNHRGRR